jgi:uncharacterized membrane protein
MRPETLHKVALAGILAGLGLSLWAMLETLLPSLQSSCSVNPFLSCGAVDRSQYSVILGVIPDWAVGLLGFAVMLAVDIPLYRTWKRSYLDALLVLSALGVIASIYFLYLEVFLIGAICPVCLSTYFANGVVLAATLALWFKGRGAPESREPDSSTAREAVDSSRA